MTAKSPESHILILALCLQMASATAMNGSPICYDTHAHGESLVRLLGEALMASPIVSSLVLCCIIPGLKLHCLPYMCCGTNACPCPFSCLQAMKQCLRHSVYLKTWSPMALMRTDSSRTVPLITASTTFLPSTLTPKSSADLVSFLIAITCM